MADARGEVEQAIRDALRNTHETWGRAVPAIAAALLDGEDAPCVLTADLASLLALLRDMAALAPPDDWGRDLASTAQADAARSLLAALPERIRKEATT